MDIRATTRLGRATIAKAKTEVINSKRHGISARNCTQCSGLIRIGNLYVQFSSIKWADSIKNPGNKYRVFSSNMQVHTNCLEDFVIENYNRKIARAKPVLTKGNKYPGAGRPKLPIEDEQVRTDRRRLIQYCSYYRLQLDKAFENNHKSLTRLKRKLGRYMMELYDPEKPYAVGLKNLHRLPQNLGILIVETDTRRERMDNYHRGKNPNYFKLGQMLVESEEEHINEAILAKYWNTLYGPKEGETNDNQEV